MALDGFTVAAIVRELKHTIENGRISKIAQPENDELLLTVKGSEGQYRLLLSASASLPLAYLTSQTQTQPHDGAQFLHAAAQAHRRRPHRVRHPAGPGAHHFILRSSI